MIEAEGIRESTATEPLYTFDLPKREKQTLRFIPYSAWANRGKNEMRVWVRTDP